MESLQAENMRLRDELQAVSVTKGEQLSEAERQIEFLNRRVNELQDEASMVPELERRVRYLEDQLASEVADGNRMKKAFNDLQYEKEEANRMVRLKCGEIEKLNRDIEELLKKQDEDKDEKIELNNMITELQEDKKKLIQMASNELLQSSDTFQKTAQEVINTPSSVFKDVLKNKMAGMMNAQKENQPNSGAPSGLGGLLKKAMMEKAKPGLSVGQLDEPPKPFVKQPTKPMYQTENDLDPNDLIKKLAQKSLTNQMRASDPKKPDRRDSNFVRKETSAALNQFKTFQDQEKDR